MPARYPKFKNFDELKSSKYLLINCIPYPPSGFVVTKATTTQLKKIGVETMKGVTDISKYKNHKSPITVNLIHKTDLQKVEDYLKEVAFKNSQEFKSYQRFLNSFLKEVA